MDRVPSDSDASQADTLAYASLLVDDHSHTRRIICIVAAAIIPFLLVTAEIVFTRSVMGLKGNRADVLAFGIGLVIGVTLIWASALLTWARIVLTLLYLPLVCFTMFHYALILVGGLYGDWL